MLMPSPTDFFSAFPLFYILNLFYSNIRALPTESPYDLFGPSQTDLGSVNIDTTNLDFWHGGEGGLESQSDTFAISSAGASPFSTLDPGSTDLFGSSPPFPNDPFQVTDSGCQAGSMDINEIAQDAFGMSDGQFDVRSELESSINHISKREDLTFGDILSDGEHACPAGKIAACCVLDRVGEVSQGSRRLRPGCIWWGVSPRMTMSCLNRNRYCCSSFEGEGNITGVDCDPAYSEEQLEQKEVPNGICKTPA